jgi:type II secretory pathway pseudopilin PulG
MGPATAIGNDFDNLVGSTLVTDRRSSCIRGCKTSRRILVGSPRGITYPLLLLGILVIGIASSGVAELWSTQVKREKEEELLFRLGEIRLAIGRYNRDHGRLPKELKDLLEDRTQLAIRHYLRRIYPDPMTGKPDWKLDTLADKAGVVAGIQDVHSQSTGKPLKVILSTKPINTYQDW